MSEQSGGSAIAGRDPDVEDVDIDDGAAAGDTAADAVETSPEPHRRSFAFWLCVIVLVGLAWRIAYVLLTRNHPVFSDTLGYHFRAQDLADGNGFVLPVRQVFGAGPLLENPPDASVPPLWSLVLAIPTKLGLRSVLSQQFATVVIGAATIAMAGIAGRQAFGRRAGLIAAGLVAVYPNVWLYERELLSESLTMFFVALLIWLVYRFLPAPSTRLALAIGVMVGVLALTRAEQILVGPLLVLPLFLAARSVPLKRRVAWLAMAGAACLLVIAPWTAYSSSRFERPVLLSTSLGVALRSGNCERTYSGDLMGYTRLNFTDVGDPRGCTITEKTFAADASLIDEQLQRAAFDFIGDNLDRVPIVSAVRIGRTFNVYRPFQQVHFEAERETPLIVLRAGLLMYWVLVPLAVLGGVVARRRGIKIYPLVVFFVIVTIAVSMTIGAVRYRSPAEIPLVLLAAVGIDHLLSRFRARKQVGADRVVEAEEPTGALT